MKLQEMRVAVDKLQEIARNIKTIEIAMVLVVGGKNSGSLYLGGAEVSVDDVLAAPILVSALKTLRAEQAELAVKCGIEIEANA